MKTTLDSSDPAGWYLCDSIHLSYKDNAFYWSGSELKVLSEGRKCVGTYTNFRRLHTEHDVEVIKADARKWAFACGKEEQETKRLKAELADMQAKLDSLETHKNNIIDTAKRANQRYCDDLANRIANPYAMRKAGKPDCVGLWLDNYEDICWVSDAQEFDEDYPPYYYLGPIPVIPVEQQPPKVVTVREKETGVTAHAIVGNIDGLYTLLSLDGKACSVVSGARWEVVK